MVKRINNLYRIHGVRRDFNPVERPVWQLDEWHWDADDIKRILYAPNLNGVKKCNIITLPV